MRFARPVAVVMLALAAAALLMEGILRVTDSYAYDALVYDQDNGLIHYEPDSTYRSRGECYDFEAPINNLGFYGPDVQREKEPGTTRVVIVGSSFVEGIQVPLEERFDTLLEAKLDRASGKEHEVVALGFPANGTYLNMLYYKEYMAELSPDVVIGIMTDFDLGKDAPTTVSPPRFAESGEAILELPETKRNEFVIRIKGLARQSKLFEALYQKYVTLRAVINQELHPELVTTQSDDRKAFAATWETEERLFRDFKKLVEESGARYLLASWTTKGHEDRDFVGSELRPITEKHGIAYLDLTPFLDARAKRAGESYMLPCEGHWGPRGHEWVAEALTEYLLRSRLVNR